MHKTQMATPDRQNGHNGQHEACPGCGTNLCMRGCGRNLGPYEECLCGGAPNAVSRPPHYTSHPSGVECITITQHHNFCVGNVIKYVWRAGLKGSEGASELQDLKKARQYLDFEIARLEKGANSK